MQRDMVRYVKDHVVLVLIIADAADEVGDHEAQVAVGEVDLDVLVIYTHIHAFIVFFIFYGYQGAVGFSLVIEPYIEHSCHSHV